MMNCLLLLFALCATQCLGLTFFPPSVTQLNSTYKGTINYASLLIPIDGFFQYLLGPTAGASRTHSVTNLNIGEPIVAEHFSFVQPNGSWTIFYLVTDVTACSKVLLEPSTPDYPKCPDWKQTTQATCSGALWQTSCSLQWPVADSVLSFSDCLVNNLVKTVQIKLLSNGTVSAEADVEAPDAGVKPPADAFNLPSACTQNGNLVPLHIFKKLIRKTHGRMAERIVSATFGWQ